MKFDQLIGILIAVLFHAGLAFGNRILPARAAAVVPVDDEAPAIALAPLPVLEAEPPDPIDALSSGDAEPADLSDLAPPPMQADTPAIATPSSFQQKLQPPPPPNLGGPVSAITIPTGNFAAASGSGLKGLLVDLAALDQRPAPRFIVKPDYPYEMSRARVRGEVVLGFIVDSEGNVRDPYVINSTNPAFEAPALRAISRWKFSPGKKGGVAVNTRNVQVPLEFGRAQ